jgi:hypothetical protein
MNFRAPVPFSEALDMREVKTLLPTELRTAMLDQIPAELRERAMFSAGVTNVEVLQRLKDSIDELTAGGVDRATKRLQAKQLLDSIGYQPAPGEEGSLTDLSSDRRLNLILDTNVAQAHGYGAWMQGQDPAILDQWPAQELVRERESEHPRDWMARWEEAGGELLDGRMIALKNDPIWRKISRFGTPYPPFDFNSGMGVEDIDRDEAIDLGLIDRDTELLPQDRGFNDDLKLEPEIRDQSLRSALVDELSGIAELVGGVFRIVKGAS